VTLLGEELKRVKCIIILRIEKTLHGKRPHIGKAPEEEKNSINQSLQSD
jgi:hypothetical protein